MNKKIKLDGLSDLRSRADLISDTKNDKFKLIYILNIDEFALINASFGIEQGDIVLKTISDKLKEISKERKCFIYRVSGDEFAVVLFEEKKSIQSMEEYAELLIAKTSKSIKLEKDKEININITCGIAFGEYDILRKAQIALRIARKDNLAYARYKDSYTSLVKKARQTKINHNKNTKALKEGILQVYYQPVVCNKTSSISKYEALSRIHHRNEIVMPGSFIPSAKKNKTYKQLSIKILEQAVKDFKDKEKILSINISTEDLVNPKFIEKVTELSKKYSLKNIVFEITESGSIRNYELVRNFIDKVSRFGIKISLDDFGTEYSNYEHLSNIDADYLKIDGKFIKDLDVNEKNRTLVKSIVELCKVLKIKTIAEFVATKEIYEIVKEMGIDFSQGFYFGEAIPIENIK